MKTKTLGVDLSRSPPQVMCEGEIVSGVTRAAVVMTPDEVPVLELRVIVFEVVGGKLPHGLHMRAHEQD